jgi:hypothetical protein
MENIDEYLDLITIIGFIKSKNYVIDKKKYIHFTYSRLESI